MKPTSFLGGLLAAAAPVHSIAALIPRDTPTSSVEVRSSESSETVEPRQLAIGSFFLQLIAGAWFTEGGTLAGILPSGREFTTLSQNSLNAIAGLVQTSISEAWNQRDRDDTESLIQNSRGYRRSGTTTDHIFADLEEVRGYHHQATNLMTHAAKIGPSGRDGYVLYQTLMGVWTVFKIEEIVLESMNDKAFNTTNAEHAHVDFVTRVNEMYQHLRGAQGRIKDFGKSFFKIDSETHLNGTIVLCMGRRWWYTWVMQKRTEGGEWSILKEWSESANACVFDTPKSHYTDAINLRNSKQESWFKQNGEKLLTSDWEQNVAKLQSLSQMSLEELLDFYGPKE